MKEELPTCCEYHNLPNGCNEGRACPEHTLKINSLVTVFDRPGVIVGKHNLHEWVVEYKAESGGITRARVNKHDVTVRKDKNK